MPRWNVRNIATQSLPFSKVSLAWASCAVFLLLETCLGLKINGAERKVTFTDPYLPEFLPELKMKGLRVGGCDRGSVPRLARVGRRNQCYSAARPSGCDRGEVGCEKLTGFWRKAGGPPQDRHRRYSHEKHPQFHRNAGNDTRAICFQCCKRIAHDLFD